MKVCYFNDSFPPLYDGVAITVENYARVFSEKYGENAVLLLYGISGLPLCSPKPPGIPKPEEVPFEMLSICIVSV